MPTLSGVLVSGLPLCFLNVSWTQFFFCLYITSVRVCVCVCVCVCVQPFMHLCVLYDVYV